MAAPLATGGRNCRLTSSEPESRTGTVPSLFTAGISDDDPQTRATSSITITVASASAPSPPYASGMCTACRPAPVSASSASCGNRDFSSTSAAAGAIISEAVRQRLLDRSPRRIEIEIEYLDLARRPDEAHALRMANFIREKYA